jgi:hypothetical protein
MVIEPAMGVEEATVGMIDVPYFPPETDWPDDDDGIL